MCAIYRKKTHWPLAIGLFCSVGGATLYPRVTIAQAARPAAALVDVLGSILNGTPLDPTDAGRAVIVADDTGLLVSAPGGDVPDAQGSAAPTSGLDSVAQQFHLQVRRMGGMTALVPSTMVVLNEDPAAPNPYLGLSIADATQLLVRTLSQSQWALIDGFTGIGPADLTDDQRLLFGQIVGPSFALRQLTARGGGLYSNDGPLRTLTSQESQGIRLRLNVTSKSSALPQVTTASGGALSAVGAIGDPSPHMPGTTLWAKIPLPTQGAAEANGVLLRAVVPNALKPSQLALSGQAAAQPIPLASGVASSFARMTVGDLVQKIGAATHTELYADTRLAPLPVWVHGGSAPVGDLLQSLCLCVTGTFRKVGPAYVLTDDVTGIGTRTARLSDWIADASQARGRLMRDMAEKQGPFQPPASLMSASTEIFTAVTGNAYKQVFHHDNTTLTIIGAPPGTLVGSSFSVVMQPSTDVKLPSEIPPTPTSGDRQLSLTYIVPGIGDVEDMNMDTVPLNQLMPPPTNAAPASQNVPPPDLSRFPARALYVTAANQAEVTEAIQAARSHGMTQLWIRPASAAQAADLLGFAVAHKGALRVYAVVSLLRADAAGLPDADLDIGGQPSAAYLAARTAAQQTSLDASIPQLANGDKYDWYPPDSPAVAGREAVILALSRLPGLDGIVVTDTSALGYADPAPYMLGEQPQFAIRSISGYVGTDLGFTPGARLEFLRQYHIDPIDLASTIPTEQVDLSLPRFSPAADQAATTAWRQALSQRDAALVTKFGADLRQACPGLPLLIGDRWNGGWFGSWDRPDLRPTFAMGPTTAHQVSRTAFDSVLPQELGADPATMAQALTYHLTRNGPDSRWDGFVFDFSEVSVSHAAALLDSALPAAH